MTETVPTQENFDVLSYVKGVAYPTSSVKVFTDAESAAELVALNKQRLNNDASEKGDAQLDETLTARIDALVEKIESSALVFSLRGLPPGIVNELYGTDDGDDADSLERENLLIARTIFSVTRGSAVDSRIWQAEDVAQLRRFLKEGEFAKLVQGVIDVTFNALVFDEATDAGFLGRSTDVA